MSARPRTALGTRRRARTSSTCPSPRAPTPSRGQSRVHGKRVPADQWSVVGHLVAPKGRILALRERHLGLSVPGCRVRRAEPLEMHCGWYSVRPHLAGEATTRDRAIAASTHPPARRWLPTLGETTTVPRAGLSLGPTCRFRSSSATEMPLGHPLAFTRTELLPAQRTGRGGGPVPPSALGEHPMQATSNGLRDLGITVAGMTD